MADLHGDEGRFVRAESHFRQWVRGDTHSEFPAEPARYHLYIAEGCPWAHRTWIFRTLKALGDVVGMSMVAGMGRQGWAFDPATARYRDRLHDRKTLREIYVAADPDYAGSCTVPVLWDEKTGRIVNNESSDIIRMLNSEFDAFTDCPDDYYPEELRSEIDALNARIYTRLNDGVYRAGFARSQVAYEEAVTDVFDTLDFLEDRLADRSTLCGERLTEADWRLFPTLVRFDVAYVSAFGCNLRRLVDYPRLWAYTRELYRQPGIAETVHPEIYKRGYHAIPIAVGHRAIVPAGPIVDFSR